MKKLISLLLVLVMVTAMAAGCTQAAPDASESTEPQANVPASALEILENIWAGYGDDEKFPIYGGNMEAGVMDAPAAYDLTYAENLPYTLLIPAEQVANVDDVASMIHMMNANTFTAGVFHLAEGVSASDFAGTMQSAVQGNQWMCGFPDKLIIAVIGGEYVLVAFGVNDAMGPFEAKLGTAYADAEIFCNEAITG